ncbi:MAG: DciA family protein [Rhizomicrobium sp.]
MAQSNAPKQPEEPPRRRGWARDVGGDVTVAAKTAFARAGFADPTLVLRWTEIAGAETARLARPIKLSEGASGGTLTLKAEPAAALFLQHESRALCARINSYLGHVAVVRLRFVQGPLAAPPPPPPMRPRAVEPAPTDPARRWRGPENLGAALLSLARRRGAKTAAD